ncbi:serine protease [Mycobacterium sp. 21AC1]|uniref:trypsin-like serine peptidase n=1 Tax=[Mycobacterium] appelbergii TaxID=2939269 RepID=UPI002939522B|nr:serine protease [Mycobacterium sp. 21AC1]MDV3125078.1 serine protease [Mycobacterium sp. 21AC1]
MRPDRCAVLSAMVAVAVTVVVGSCAPAAHQRAAGAQTRPATSAAAEPENQVQADAVAVAVTPDPRVGALFLGGVGADSLHTCSAAVLDTPGGDLILTAAHCLADGVDTAFIPGFQEGADDVWQVGTVYLDSRWIAEQDPHADFAIARVSRDGRGLVQSETGEGLSLGSAPAAGSAVSVTGYPMGVGGGALGCRGVTGLSPEGFPSLQCAGLTDGFSGAPWVIGATVTGLVGGPDGGGCDDDVSYSPVFDDSVGRLLARAEAGGDGDAAPAAFATDC